MYVAEIYVRIHVLTCVHMQTGIQNFEFYKISFVPLASYINMWLQILF
jgi:hypothetical protein